MLSAPLTCCSIGAPTLLRHHVAGGARVGGGDRDLRRRDVGILRDRQAEHRQRAAERDDDRDDRREYRPVDAEVGDVHGGGAVSGLFRLSVSAIFSPATRDAPAGSVPGPTPDGTPAGVTSGAGASMTFTTAPGDSLMAPSTTTLSPGTNPWLTNTPSPCQSPISTSRRAALPSLSMTHT